MDTRYFSKGAVITKNALAIQETTDSSTFDVHICAAKTAERNQVVVAVVHQSRPGMENMEHSS